MSLINEFNENFQSFEKFQAFVINDLTNATIKANANFLVSMGVFNYMEILGSFTYPEITKGICSKRFNHTLRNLYPNSYEFMLVNLDKLSGSKNNAYEIFRSGMTHEYNLKTYIKAKGVENVRFEIVGVSNETEYLILLQTKRCGIEIFTLDEKNYTIRLYNPCLIRDLNTAFETYKSRLIDDLGNLRDSFNSRCRSIHFDSLK